MQSNLYMGGPLVTETDLVEAGVLQAAGDPGLHHGPRQLLTLLLRVVEVDVEVVSHEDSHPWKSLLDLQQM